MESEMSKKLNLDFFMLRGNFLNDLNLKSINLILY